MGTQSIETTRRPRADAVRNRERVLAAAKAVFSKGGADASLEAVAKRAGVGIGTLYRHFPTREALFEAVYRHEVQQLSELAEQLKDETSPVEALRRWLHSDIELVATKKGMSAALALAVHGSSELYADSSERLAKAVGVLLDRAVAAGEIRSDIRRRRSAARARRHVLHARSARLAGERSPPRGCLRRWSSSPSKDQQSKSCWRGEASTNEARLSCRSSRQEKSIYEHSRLDVGT